MPTKYDLGYGNLTLFNTTTGKELSNLDNVHLNSCEVEKGTQFGNWMRQNTSITMDFTTDEKDDFNKILGLDVAQMPDPYDIQYVKIVQARKHKKKRINKKWLKRYGYKKVIVNSKGWNVKTYADGTVEFVK
ncbi:hypothetical protein [uncultured Eubacterium sp.]|uniref:hypothetical protein n=1 Tax=uncultured Eubacterium sp. TaxID=165185 RepID=UPI0025964372|nr:hypothetical protein [uncultured Eubacterium sp.]